MNDHKVSEAAENVSAFLEKICNDRDGEINQITQRRDDEIRTIIAKAYSESRQFHREQAELVRQQYEMNSTRRMARTRSQLRHRRWQVLTRLQNQAVDKVLAQMLQAWKAPSTQWQWCEYWIAAAMTHTGADYLRVHLGEGATPETGSELRKYLSDHAQKGEVVMDAELQAGIVVYWNHSYLDGRIASQREIVEPLVLERLTQWMHGDE